MRAESDEQPRPLRHGYTTGACATAAATAAARVLLTGAVTDAMGIELPRRRTVVLPLAYCHAGADAGEAGVIKDAGDDPDVTHGALVFVRVERRAEPGIVFAAGPGVGTVTREGLALAVGEPAINPVPRKMIGEHLAEVAAECGHDGGFQVTVGIENGEALAAKTMNPRLGIVGGLSVLGTTGIVRPFSCAAYIASIRQGIDVARTNGMAHIAACTGASSEAGIRARYDLPDMALIEMGDFVGAVLKHLRRSPVPRLSIAGGFGKLTKMAAGAMDLHSRSSSVDFDFLAEQARACGGDDVLCRAIRSCNTSLEALGLAQAANVALAERIVQVARERALESLGGDVQVEVWAFARDGTVLGAAGVA